MRKSEGITKYEVKWQLIRSTIKGQKTPLNQKLEEVYNYFNETRTYDRWERVYNWLEGLERGYKAAGDLVSINLIKDVKASYELLKGEGVTFKDSYSLDMTAQHRILDNTRPTNVEILWKDLFKTNRKWLQKGYYHKECNEFMDWLWKECEYLTRLVTDTYSMKKLQELRSVAKETENTHNFFF